MIYAASKPGAKNYLTGKDVGLTSFEKVKLNFPIFGQGVYHDSHSFVVPLQGG